MFGIGNVRKLMIYLKEEPFFKKAIKILIVCIILIYSLFIIYQLNIYKKIYKYDTMFFTNIIEKLSKYYPEESLELIDDLLIGDDDFNILIDSEENSTFDLSNINDFHAKNKYIKVIELIKIDIIILGVVLIILLGSIYFSFKKIGDFFNDILNTISNILKGNYYNNHYKTQEGLMGKIYSELSHLENYIQIKENELIAEKEETKSLVTDISHQLKTPLASVKMSNYILINDNLDEGERREFLEVSEENISKLEMLIEALIQISRLEAGMIKLEPKKSGIKEVMTKAINGIYVKALEKDIDIEIHEFEDFIVFHDGRWTEQAIVNVLDNAIKYSKVGSKIEIKIYDGINYITIGIKDYGMGIDHKDYNNIFKRFYRGKGNSTEGSGVGLFLTRKILEEQGGSISVKSKLGVGSEFKILLRK